MLCKAVSQYWQSQMPSTDMQQEIELLSYSLQELDTTDDTTTTTHKKLNIYAITARELLNKLGYSWKDFKKVYVKIVMRGKMWLSTG